MEECGNVIVDVGVQKAQTQEAKHMHRVMQRDGACNRTALIYFFILLGKVIEVLFVTLVPSSCLFDDANPLERYIVYGDLPWMCCMLLLSSGCGQLEPRSSQVHLRPPLCWGGPQPS